MLSLHHGRLAFLALLLAATPLAIGCGDDDDDSSNNGDGDGDGDGDRFAGCTKIIESGSDTEQVQQVFLEAVTGDTICFADGVYALNEELSLSVNDVTVQGNPDPTMRDAVVLDYATQVEGKDALTASGDGFTLQNLSIKNSSGNTVVTEGVDRVTFRNVKVSWDAGSVVENGAYAVYPLSANNVLVENCEVVGASDAGIYVGQSTNIIVRNNKVYGNVAGIEIENSDNALVTGNEAYDNTSGILVFVLPNLEKKSGSGTIVENNIIRDNNRENFAEEGTVVSFVPSGTGMLILANDNTEVRNNTMSGNRSAAVLAVSYQTFTFICIANGGSSCASSDPATDPNVSKLYVHDNTLENNGADPDPTIALLLGSPLPNVLWDGVTPPDALTDQLCLGTTPTSVLQFGDNAGLFDAEEVITDPNLFTCTLPSPFETIALPQDG